MRAVVQRVSQASVISKGEETGNISDGLLVYLGVQKGDTEKSAKYLADKIINLRIFEDSNGKMNLSLKDLGLELLVVSQFTLQADARKGRRPSYNKAELPEKAEYLYERFLEFCSNLGFPPQTGIFQSYMQITSVNTGPVTILLDSEKVF
ncbi:MAG: D-aminoacyl-tRNA deacylase [Spirochaetia bacterium]